MPERTEESGSIHLGTLFARRWSVPVLGQFDTLGGGGKLVTVTRAIDANPASVRASIDHLVRLGLVQPNPGHGHPLRPEYILTPRGAAVAPSANALCRTLVRLDAIDRGLRKWTMPTLSAVSRGADRFATIRDSLATATDRALSGALTDLEHLGLVSRVIEPGRPPRPRYGAHRRARVCNTILDEISTTLGASV